MRPQFCRRPWRRALCARVHAVWRRLVVENFGTNPSDEIVNVELLFFSGKETAHRPSKLDSLDGKRIVLQPGATRSVDLALSKLDTKNIGWAVAKTDAPINIFSTFDFSIPQNLPNLASEIPELAAVNSQASEPNCALCLSANSTPGTDQIGPPPAPPGGPSDRPPDRPGPKNPPGRPAGRPPVSVPVTTPSVTARVTNISGVTVLPSGNSFSFPVSIYGSKDFGAAVALANPNQTDATISIELVFSDGVQTLNRVIQLPAHGQSTRSLTDPSLFEIRGATPDRFDGSITVCSDVPIGLVAIGTAGKMAFTLPVSDSNRCGQKK